jgi:uncharacterized protein (DUF1499 family)
MLGKVKRMAAWIAITLGVIVVAARIANRSARPEALGLTRGKLSPCPDSPNCVCSEDPSGPHAIAPLEFKGAPNEAVTKLKLAVLGMRRVTLVEERDGYLHAEFRSALLGFVDDVEFSMQPEAKRIQVRSASRVGNSDLGVNRRRVEEIRRRFSQLKP